MSVPFGTIGHVPITVNHLLDSFNSSNFTYQKDVSAKLASDAVFKSYIESSQNIAIYDPELDVTCPRVTYLDLVNNKLLIYFDGVSSSSIDKIFWVCVGLAVNQDDSALAFTLSNYSHYYPFNDFSNGATSPDPAGGHTCTRSTNAEFGIGGQFGNGAGCHDDDELTSAAKPSFDGAQQYTFEGNCWFLNSAWAQRQYISHYGDGTNYIGYQRYLAGASSRFEFGMIKAGSGSGAYILVSAAGILDSTWFNYAWVFDGTLVGNANRLKCFINGVQQTVYFYSASIPSSLPTFPPGFLWTHGAISGETTLYFGIDEEGLSATARDVNFLLTRYYMIYNASFWTTGNFVFEEVVTTSIDKILLNPVIGFKLETIPYVRENLTSNDYHYSVNSDIKINPSIESYVQKICTCSYVKFPSISGKRLCAVNFSIDLYTMSDTTISPSYYDIIRACGWRELPISGGVSIYPDIFYNSVPASIDVALPEYGSSPPQLVYKLSGCMGSVKFIGKTGYPIKAEFSFLGSLCSIDTRSNENIIMPSNFDDGVFEPLLGVSFNMYDICTHLSEFEISCNGETNLFSEIFKASGYSGTRISDFNTTGKVVIPSTSSTINDIYHKIVNNYYGSFYLENGNMQISATDVMVKGIGGETSEEFNLEFLNNIVLTQKSI